MNPVIDSLVLYKNQPAIVRQLAEKKLTIELLEGQQVSVRPKDVALLHPGPVSRNSLDIEPEGDVQTAWELLAGGQTTLPELAELSFGAFTPATAWAIWQYVADGAYFEGTPDLILVHTVDRVAEIQATRETKAAEERDWDAFVDRVTSRATTLDDERYLSDVIALALGRSETSRTLRRLDRPQMPEAAHELLLAIGRWQPADNPYPSRMGLTIERPEYLIAGLPDEERRDLTHLLALAIDDEGSNDPDDAISMDGERLWVHVADAAALVPPDSPADVEARGRSANLYLPEGTVRMLPDELTERLALGLMPVSPALSFAIAPNSDGNFELVEIVPSWIQVTRTCYEAVDAVIEESPYRDLVSIIERNRDRRLSNGAVEIDLPEVKIKAAVDGTVSIRPLPPLLSRKLVREVMLMAGEAVGRFGLTYDLPLPFTTQDPPLEGIEDQEDLSDATPSRMWSIRRKMQRSRQTTSPGRHSGLGLDVYVQVTSPLRRYLDLLAHQQIRAYLRKDTLLNSSEVLLRIATADAVAGAVRAAERLSNQHWTIVYLMQHPNWEGEGIVVEHKPGKEVILIPSLAWETEIYRRSLHPLDSVLHLALESVDLPNRSVRFREI